MVYDIITIGSATVDVFANTTSQLVKLITQHGEEDFITYPSGSKILIKDISFLIGGGGTNTAVSFSRLGLKTAFLGKLGSDENAEKVVNLLKKENIDFLGKQEGQTGYSIILDSIEHDRTILTFKGSNNNLKAKDVDLSFLKTKWIYSSSMVGESYNTLKSIFEYAKAHGVKIVFNPSAYQAKQGYEELKDVLHLLDVLVLNLEEAQLLLDKEGSAKELAPQLSTSNKDYVVITDGANGSTCYHNGFVYHITPTSFVKVVETTGAGDAFASAFVTGLVKEASIEDCLKLGIVQSESVIAMHGAKEKLLTKEEAHSKLYVFDGKFTSEKIVVYHEDHLPTFSVASKDQGFHLKNGKIIQSVEELGYFLKYAPEDLVSEHIGEGFNHFADWIEHVFENHELARLIREKKDKKDISECLLAKKA